MKTIIILLIVAFLLTVQVVAQGDSPITAENVADLAQIAVLDGHSEAVNDIAFSPDGHYLVSASDDITVLLWDVESRSKAGGYDHISFAKSVAFSPVIEEGTYLLASAGWDRRVILSDVSSDGAVTEREVLEGFESIAEEIAFSPDGEQMAFGIGDGTIQYYDVRPPDAQAFEAQAADEAALELPSLRPTALVFSGDSQYVLAASGFPDTSIQVWDAGTREQTFTLEGHEETVVGLAAHPSEPGVIASVDSAGQVMLWDIAQEEDRSVASSNRDGEWFTDVAFLPAGDLLLTSTLDGELFVWEINADSELNLLAEFAVLDTPIIALAVHPDGHLLAFASDDGTIHLWGV